LTWINVPSGEIQLVPVVGAGVGAGVGVGEDAERMTLKEAEVRACVVATTWVPARAPDGTANVDWNVPFLFVKMDGMPAVLPSHVSWTVFLGRKLAPETVTETPGAPAAGDSVRAFVVEGAAASETSVAVLEGVAASDTGRRKTKMKIAPRNVAREAYRRDMAFEAPFPSRSHARPRETVHMAPSSAAAAQ
jgi:hypothetical protein